MNLNDKLKQERTGLTASQYSDLQELFVDRYVDGMTTKDLVEYVYNDMMQYVENQPEQEFLDDCKDYWDDAYDEIIQEIKEGDIELTDNDDNFIDINNTGGNTNVFSNLFTPSRGLQVFRKCKQVSRNLLHLL